MPIKLIDPSIEKLSFELDGGAGERARIGLLVLESDQSLEWEIRKIANLEGVAVYHSRLENDPIVTGENLAMMEKQLPVAAKLLPKYLNLNSIGYGCTSASTIIGERRVKSVRFGQTWGDPVGKTSRHNLGWCHLQGYQFPMQLCAVILGRSHRIF